VRPSAASLSFLVSAAIHGLLLAHVFSIQQPTRRPELIDVQITERSPEKKPDPAPPKVAALPPPVAQVPRKSWTPPPPNSPPPRRSPPKVVAPVRIGIAMSSTTEAGQMGVSVGNTLYGKPPDRAADPAGVKPYRDEEYAPPAELTTLPEPVETSFPKDEYPEEARRLGIEGAVRLRLRVDRGGRVREALIVDGPGHGLAQAAVRRALRFWQFRPARRGNDVVAAEIPFTVRFELP